MKGSREVQKKKNTQITDKFDTVIPYKFLYIKLDKQRKDKQKIRRKYMWIL